MSSEITCEYHGCSFTPYICDTIPDPIPIPLCPQHYQECWSALLNGKFMNYVDVIRGKKSSRVHPYLITFTRAPSLCSRVDWLDGLRRVLSRKSLGTSWDASLEHLETNIHCHVIARELSYAPKKSHYKLFERKYGTVDIKPIKVDNGVADYVEKDGKLFSWDNYNGTIALIAEELANTDID